MKLPNFITEKLHDFLSLSRWPYLVPIIATICLIAIGYVGWEYSTSADEASQWATYVSTIVSAVALIWFVAGFRLQTTELLLQRQELELQRVAAQQQAVELNNAAKLGSLEQIRSLLEDAEKAIKDSAVGISSNTQIQQNLFKKMTLWKEIDESRVPERVSDLYSEWLPYEAAAKNYVRYVATALKIYITYHFPSEKIDPKIESEEFLVVYSPWGNNAPFLSHHIGVATILANLLWLMSPGLDRMRLAWMVASAKIFERSMFVEGALEELRDKVLKTNADLPKICDPWPILTKQTK